MEPEESKEFEKDHKVDPESLDLECLMQSELYYKWSNKAAEARIAHDTAKMELDRAQAKVELRIRKCPEKYGLRKQTESSIKAAVNTNKSVMEQQNQLLAAKGRMMTMDRAEKAMDMKKRMLECLIQLHGQQYFAGPTTPRDLVEAKNRRDKAREEVLNEKQKKRVRIRKVRK